LVPIYQRYKPLVEKGAALRVEPTVSVDAGRYAVWPVREVYPEVHELTTFPLRSWLHTAPFWSEVEVLKCMTRPVRVEVQ